VVDEGAFVVGAEKDEGAVDREELVRADAVELALLVHDPAKLVLL
jgi:hypothetical protein